MSMELPQYTAPDFAALGLADAPDAPLAPAPRDGVAPEGFHATSIYPEYVRAGGRWLLAEDSRMDSVLVVRPEGRVEAVEFRRLRAGDLVVLGRGEDGAQGIFLHTDGFSQARDAREAFAFRQGRSRETAYSPDYRKLARLLTYERDHGSVVWVLGPACVFDAASRDAMASLVEKGYVHGLLAGNALATHDLEGGLLGTALGQDIRTQESIPLGHYHHLDVLNKVRACGSIPAFLREYGVESGVMAACVRGKVPFVLAGSIRDDGPLPEVEADVYQAQNRMRDLVRRATTVVALATQLHSIAVGNMTPSYRVVEGKVRPTFFYSVDASEFAVNKLRDRGSLAVTTMVTNVQDFVTKLAALVE